MITLRPISFPADHARLMEWWAGRGGAPIDARIFPSTGFVAESDGDAVAMSFLYLDVGGAFAMIEWTSTNPAFVFSKAVLVGVKALYAKLEEVARAKECLIITSMVAPGTGEERILARMGYAGQSPLEPPHRMFAKPLITCPQPS